MSAAPERGTPDARERRKVRGTMGLTAAQMSLRSRMDTSAALPRGTVSRERAAHQHEVRGAALAVYKGCRAAALAGGGRVSAGRRYLAICRAVAEVTGQHALGVKGVNARLEAKTMPGLPEKIFAALKYGPRSPIERASVYPAESSFPAEE